MFNYCNDENLDGSVLNFNKLIINPPLTSDDQGEYTVYVDDSLNSNGYLVLDPSQVQSTVFKPEFYVKKTNFKVFKIYFPQKHLNNKKRTQYTQKQ